VRRRTRAALALALAAALGGCLGGDDERPAEPGGPLTIYMSLPARGLEADEAAAVEAGGRLALARAGGRVGGRAVRMVRLDSTKAPGTSWDPGQVEANAERASDDPSAIAYVGELDQGASAVSVPVTNDAGLFQVSPLDSLTSLTRTPPGRAGRGAPERYYPTGRRSFLRLVPNDLREADLLTARVETLGAERVALVAGDGVYGVELASQLAQRLRRAGRTIVASEALRDEPGAARSAVAAVAEARPDVVVYSGAGDRPAALLFAEVARALPATPVLVTSGVLARAPLRFGAAPASVEAFSSLRPVADYGPGAQRLLEAVRRRAGARAARAEALYGYEAVRLVLDAVRDDGPRRAAVLLAGLRPGVRRARFGTYVVRPGGDVSGPPMTLYRLRDGGFEAVASPIEPSLSARRGWRGR
jgi:branched-chain amino acid transport system substrate-binding protein